jgi:succinoglycan biosynthesis protein ExoV
MKIFWSVSGPGNVGDDLNPLLWRSLFGEGFFDDDPAELFIGVGSVLSTMWHYEPGARKIVFGAGARSSWSLPAIDSQWDLRFVRGPNSAHVLRRFDVPYITDPAIMLPAVLQPRPSRPAPGGPRRIGFVPHHRTPQRFIDRVVRDLDLVEVSTHLDAQAFVDALCACDHIVAEAMHGAILADAYRIPWMGVRIVNELFEGPTTSFKWADWRKSLQLPGDCVVQSAPAAFRFARKGLDKHLYRIVASDAVFDRFMSRTSRLIAARMKSDRWHLSDAGLAAQKRARIQEEIVRLKRDYPA